jgi:hypothetical protein
MEVKVKARYNPKTPHVLEMSRVAAAVLANLFQDAVLQNAYVFYRFIIQTLMVGVDTPSSSAAFNDLHRRS